ncbi:RNA polymerase sigma-70 factor (ECF subfamily) [Roseivirga pacifica]|nr:RNA polymerase sigma-70 factor (ECF subfamily) [Roseivirga pacifica]
MTEDQKIMLAIKAGNESSFEEVYNRFWEPLFVSARNVLGDEESARDIIQEVFLDFWNRRESLNIHNLGGYLYQSVKYQVSRKLKDRRLTDLQLAVVDQLSIDNLDTEQTVNLTQLNEALQRSLQKLPTRCRQVFELSRFENMSNKEIAEKLNISVSTVENQINKALGLLKSEELLIGLFLMLFNS